MKLMDLQILVKGFVSASYEARRFKQKEIAFPLIFCHLKLSLNSL